MNTTPRTGAAGLLRGLLRGLRLLPWVLVGYVWTLRHGRGGASAAGLARLRQRWLAGVVRRCGVRVQSEGHAPTGAALVVANHVSWVDIPVLGSMSDLRFLAKAEIAGWPVIGYLARRHGTLFIPRGGHHARRLSGEIAAALARGERVLIFPEGTTTRGETVRRFHARLLEAALEAGVPLQPVVIDYGRAADGMPPVASYADDDVLLPHAWRLLRQPQTPVRVQWLAPIPTGEGSTRSLLAEQARAAILEALEAGRGVPQNQ
jgi:lyso-ornithine lipid O-acyltransferase